jgi:crotonobetainyl-CoA:carnitine CoA-transferase CaiB-like acyl-CoA transferase
MSHMSAVPSIPNGRLHIARMSKTGKAASLRMQSQLPFLPHYGKWIIILAMTDKQWVSLCEAIGRPDLSADARFARARDRVQRRDEIIRTIEHWLAAMPSDDASVETLRRHRVPVAPILSVREATEHPHLIARGTVRTVNRSLIPGQPDLFTPGKLTEV